MKKKETSLTESAYRALHEDLVTCRLPPGVQLKTSDLTKRHNVGLAAVREALARLSSEGLVDASPQRGFRATPITPERLQDLTTVRIDIETMCLRQSMPQFDELADVRLDQALEAMLVADVGSDEQLAARNRRQRHAHFHEALVAGCRSQVLLGIRRQLFTQSERYRSLTEPLRSGDETLDRDHRRMVEAVQRRDTDLACDLLTEHIRETSRLLLVAKINGEDVIPRA